ncbi:MAG: dTDP-glucose 4,6-dehydratase [Candidatus Binatia bacterium]
MKLVVTGGAGFIGSGFVRAMLARHPDVSIVTLDALTYAGNLANLESVRTDSRHRFVRGDITDANAVDEALAGGVDAIVHFAAESHVDRSIEDASAFLQTNVIGTQVLLDGARRHRVGRFVHVSTDEVYGSLGAEGRFTEESPLDPSSPYAASKAASDLLVFAYVRTHGIDAVVTRCSNNFGPFQFPEKVIPLFVTNAMANEPLPLYGDGMNVRDWIHVEDHCEALDLVLRKGRCGEVYNVSAESERANRDLTREILRRVGKPETLIRKVADRPGHDRRYALDAAKLRKELGWTPRWRFEDALDATIAWYRDNEAWWRGVKSGEYLRFYDQWYGGRLEERS